MTDHRAGVVALLGRPNAGKSTLLNAILGEKLAIVTAKPQTTRSRLLGILTRPGAQILFVDTPGLHDGARTLNAELNARAVEAADDCEVALVLAELDGRPKAARSRAGPGGDRTGAGWREEHASLARRLAARGTPVLAVGTKLDRPGAADAAWPPPGLDRTFRVSARTGEGVAELVDAVVALLPASPPLYPEDDLSDRPLRFLAAELVREAAFDALDQELPYALAVEVEAFDESREDLVRIRANLIVERESQKPIAIGRGGARIKAIGIAARREIEALLERRVHLELRVVVERNWTKKPARIRSLGYV